MPSAGDGRTNSILGGRILYLMNSFSLFFLQSEDLLSSWNVHLLLNVSKIDIEISREFEILKLHDNELMLKNFPFLYEVNYRLDGQHEQLRE